MNIFVNISLLPCESVSVREIFRGGNAKADNMNDFTINKYNAKLSTTVLYELEFFSLLHILTNIRCYKSSLNVYWSFISVNCLSCPLLTGVYIN